MGWCWAALAALAIAPAASASTGFEGEYLDWRAMLDVQSVALPTPGSAVPNPVTLALDAADAWGLALGAHDAEGFVLTAAPMAPVYWYPGLMDERALHPQWALAGHEDTTGHLDVALAAPYDVYDAAASYWGLAPSERPDYRTDRLPRMLLDFDAADLRLSTEVEVPSAQAHALPSPEPSQEGSAGAASEQGVVGIAPASSLGPVFPSPGGEALARALAPPAGAPQASSIAPAVAAGPAPPPPLAEDAAVLALGVATGLVLGGLALYHLVNRNNIFENDVRMQVYDVVARNPGVTIQEVARVVGLSHPTARYHLNVLAKNDLVVFLDKGNKMMFFRNRNEYSEQEREIVAILRNPEAMRVYECIEASPWILRKELSERLGISRTSVNWHLRNLMRASLVAETREQGKGFLFVRREGRELLVRVQRRVGPQGRVGPQAVPAAPAAVALPAPAGSGHQQAA